MPIKVHLQLACAYQLDMEMLSDFSELVLNNRGDVVGRCVRSPVTLFTFGTPRASGTSGTLRPSGPLGPSGGLGTLTPSRAPAPTRIVARFGHVPRFYKDEALGSTRRLSTGWCRRLLTRSS